MAPGGKDIEAATLFQKIRVKRIYGPLTAEYPVRVDFTEYGRTVFATDNLQPGRVKSGIFGQTAKFGQPPCLFHSSVIEIQNKLTKQTVKILMKRFLRSRLIWISPVCKCVSELT